MSIKRNNRFLLYFILIFSLGQFLFTGFGPRWGIHDLALYLVCLLLGIWMLRKDGTPFFEALPYNVPVKPGTLLLTAALTFSLMPLSALLSTLGGRIGGDMMDFFSKYMAQSDNSFAENLFSVALIPAVFEEMFFRGFFYAGFKRARGARCAIWLTSVLFGFFHMNVQQILYAAVVGVFLAVLRELTGSMWPGMLFHFVNNGMACVALAVPEDSFFWKLPIERLTFEGNASQTVYAAVMTVLCTALAVFLIVCIAKREGRTEDMRHFFRRADDPKEKLGTASFVLACVVFALFTLLVTLMLLLFRFLPEEMLTGLAAGR